MRRMTCRTYILVLLSVFGFLALGCAGVAQAAVTGVTVATTENGSELLTFKSNTPVKVKKSFALEHPDRIVIDIPNSSATGVGLPKTYKGALLKSIRFGQFDATTSRIVLDLKAPAIIVATTSGAPFSIEIAPAGRASAVAATDAVAPPPKASSKPLIIIDAGHGGQDPGALGMHGTREKDVTLNYARALRDALLATGRYRAQLTRDDDRFILLPDRVAIARKAKGDIFISIHADSNPKKEARGLSVYTLSETASDDEAAALAEHENKSDIVEGIDLSTTDPDVASILIDLTQRETMNKSAIFADAVVASLHGKVTKLPKTHRYAGFRVLKASDIPSILIELGFLSNATDERLLLSPEYRAAVIQSIVKGIDRFHAGE